MILYIINHDFQYETENVLRIFFPLEKIKTIKSNDSLKDFPQTDFTYTEIVNFSDYSRIICKIKLKGEDYNLQEDLYKNEKDSKQFESSLELTLAKLIYNILTGALKITPPWGVLTGVRPTKLMRSLLYSLGEKDALEYFTTDLLVKDEKAKLCLNVVKNEEEIIKKSDERSYSLYISIPFCPTRCDYCSFVSHSIEKAKNLMPIYVERLIGELIEISKIAGYLGLNLKTIYIGGGTPTSLESSQIKAILNAVNKYFPAEKALEFTVEAGRPDTVNPKKLRILKDAGVGRISVNPQTFNDEVLKIIGRRHTSNDALKAYEEAKKADFDCINMDFIAGLPKESPESFISGIEKAVSLSPENITVHTLALKRASNIAGDLNDISENAPQMIWESSKILNNNGYFPYYMYRQSKSVGNNENTGYSQKGKECLYNVFMMEETHTVLSAGAGGVTKLKKPNENVIERVFNYKYPYEYIERYDDLIERKRKIIKFYENV